MKKKEQRNALNEKTLHGVIGSGITIEHQRRPEMYHLLTRDVKMWQDYPEIPWNHPECETLVNRAQL